MRFSWHGLAAVILALCLGGGVAAVLIIAALRGAPLDEGGTAALTHIGAGLAGGLATWLGGQVSRRRTDNSDDAG